MSEQPQSPPLDEGQIVSYLHQHPDFFNRHPALLTALSLPHPDSGQAISLAERQLAILREQKAGLERKLQQLTATARNNEGLFDRIEGLILGLIDASAVEQVLERLYESLRQDFHADAIELHLFDTTNTQAAFQEAFSSLLSQRIPMCGHLTERQRLTLFPHQATDIASAAVIPLCGRGHECLGLLGIGSIDRKRFHPEMGTAFLSHLGAVLSSLLLKVRQHDAG